MQINELKGRIVAKGYTQEQFAQMLGMSKRSWWYRLKKKEFGSNDIKKMIELLDIQNPADIFFKD